MSEIRPSTVLKMLERLAEHGSTHGGWCMCLVCRVMRIARTEKARYSSEQSIFWDSESKTTKMIDWRGGAIEFAKSSSYEDQAKPPWYVIRMKRRRNNDGRHWYYWLDYAGPPMVFLTRANAEKQAKSIRQQYKGTYKVEVIKIKESK